MNKYIKKVSPLLLGLIVLGTSCAKKDFDNNYYNPEASVSGDIPKLYSGLLYNHKKQNANTIFPRYWNLYTFQIPMIGTYTQTFGYYNGNARYEQQTAYTQLRWNYYYTGPLASFREMQKYYDALNGEEKEGYRLFMETGKIFLYDQTAQMIDMWGDIPFSEAGQLVYTGGDIVNGKYDNQKELYNLMLDDLKSIADYLSSQTTPDIYKNMFNAADLINMGNIEDWKIYANSLRLRLAMRISYEDENKAKAIVTEILTNPNQYPVVSTNDNSVKIDARGGQLRSVIGVDGIKASLESSDYNLAPGYMVNSVMAPSNDPRLRAMFAPNANGQYKGMDINKTATAQTDEVRDRLVSRMDSATYSRNDKYPGIIITAAEVSLLKAEAAERWGISGVSAASEYAKGIRQSIDFIYYINELNDNADGTSYTPEVKPTEAEITTFLNSSIVSYTGSAEQKLEKIGIQKWINFGLLQSPHAWAEYRRTKYPALVFSVDNSSTQAPTPPVRLLYPENERVYNTANYEAVKSKDNVTTKIFWDVK
ncbi:MAG: SusD/RagB family nutrient-binding outer membrane lipoprotein [Niabella sp.]